MKPQSNYVDTVFITTLVINNVYLFYGAALRGYIPEYLCSPFGGSGTFSIFYFHLHPYFFFQSSPTSSHLISNIGYG